MHYTTKEAAKLLGYKVQTLHKWAAYGGPITPIRVGRRLKWRKADVDAILGMTP